MPEQKRPLKVFLCHAHVDKDAAKALHDRLVQDGVDAWLDKEKLFAGANWEFEIRKAVRDCDIFVVCVSQQFTQRSRRKNFSQTEVGIALNEAELKPKDQIYIIPVRLENCAVPKALQPWHWVDLFEPDGYQKLIRSLNKRIEELDAVEADKGQPGQGNISVVVSGDVSGNLIIGNQNKIHTNIPDEIEVQQKAEREAADKAALEKAEREVAEKAAREKEEHTKTKYLDIQDRVLEAAIEKEITVGNAAQLFVLIKQKDSKGIISIVNAIDEEVVLDESNVKTREIQIEFPVENYQRMPAELTIRLDAPDFHIPNMEKYILVPPDGDSEVSTFMVTPKRAGKLLINIEVLKGKNNLAAKTIRTTAIMADVRNKSFALFSLPLIVLAQPVSSLPTSETKEMIAPQDKSNDVKNLWIDIAPQQPANNRQIKVEHRVAIIVAIIGAIATILAALIGLLPQLFPPAPVPTATNPPLTTAAFTQSVTESFTNLPPSQTPESRLMPTQLIPTSHPSPIPSAKGLSKIAFAQYDGIYIVDANGENIIRLSNRLDEALMHGYAAPKWSPDGTKIAFLVSKDGENGLYVVNFDGSEQKLLTNKIIFGSGMLDWSPDNEKLVYVTYNDEGTLAIVSVNDKTKISLTDTPNSVFDISWDPSGSKIAFSSRRTGVFVINADGSNETKVFDLSNCMATLNCDAKNIRWSPDGSKLAFVFDKSYSIDDEIYLVDINTKETIQLTKNQNADSNPVFSPDGLQLAFVSSRQGSTSEIFIMNIDGSNVRKITNFADRKIGITILEWLPNNTLFFKQTKWDGSSYTSYTTQFMKISIDLGILENVSTTLSGLGYDFSP
jgi:Tol biopolymer transport system component